MKAEEKCTKCQECGKSISWDEYCVNFGLCDDCLNRHYGEYLSKHPEDENLTDDSLPF